ncbi:hypothetical protein EVAR_87911_1 [Eumeta japonica]|uniref:Uncharacterized protein n=1 Tax=Eumeta variegata TaxID=151549 RepID=A0A4C1WXK7_EUMVA|nr:hypothetical protein EVAR_87911_1 [Eumeta japonica]
MELSETAEASAHERAVPESLIGRYTWRYAMSVDATRVSASCLFNRWVGSLHDRKGKAAPDAHPLGMLIPITPF